MVTPRISFFSKTIVAQLLYVIDMSLLTKYAFLFVESNRADPISRRGRKLLLGHAFCGLADPYGLYKGCNST